MVGCVIVHRDRIVGEGWHGQFGAAHAEVEAVRSMTEKSLVSECDVYVNLEPCAHHGKTPPCADMLAQLRPKRVIVANVDPFAEVAGKGLQKLRDAGIEVVQGILEEEGQFLNRRFFVRHRAGRPYIILKWAQTFDGCIGVEGQRIAISNPVSHLLAQQMRAHEDAILVGTQTVLADNPRLTLRDLPGRQPLRIMMDRQGIVPTHAHILDDTAPTLVLGPKPEGKQFEQTRFSPYPVQQGVPDIVGRLAQEPILSVVVEGGAKLLKSFLAHGMWDEAWVFESSKPIGKGIAAPYINQLPEAVHDVAGDRWEVYFNKAGVAKALGYRASLQSRL